MTPSVASANDTSAVEVGVKFHSDVAGSITGIRFYKGPTQHRHARRPPLDLLRDAPGHRHLQQRDGLGLAAGQLRHPGVDTANTTYVASYFAPAGGYAVDSNYFATSGYDNAPLHALADGVDGGDGVYAYGSGNTFPIGSYQSSNYWVDVVFTNPPPLGSSPSMKVATPSATVATPLTTVATPSSATVATPSPNKTQKQSNVVQTERVSSSVGHSRRGDDDHVDGPRRGPGRDLG